MADKTFAVGDLVRAESHPGLGSVEFVWGPPVCEATVRWWIGEKLETHKWEYLYHEMPDTRAARDCDHGQHARTCDRCEDAREIARLTEQANEWKAKYESLFVQDDALKAAVDSLYEQRDALLAACEAAEERLEQLKDGADEDDRESICGTLGILASARLRARGGDR